MSAAAPLPDRTAKSHPCGQSGDAARILETKVNLSHDAKLRRSGTLAARASSRESRNE